MAKMKSDAHLYISDVGVADAAPVTITSITKANPAVCTVTTMPTGFVNGDFMLIEGTGEPTLDGQFVRAESVTGTTFHLDGVDGTQFVAAITKGTAQPFTVTGTNAMLSACMSQITVTGQAPDSINLDDMCTNETVLGEAKPPTFTFTGFVDNASTGYRNLIQASIFDPKPTVWVLVDFGEGGGYIFGPAQVGEVTITATAKAGLQFSGAGIFTEIPTYSWALPGGGA